MIDFRGIVVEGGGDGGGGENDGGGGGEAGKLARVRESRRGNDLRAMETSKYVKEIEVRKSVVVEEWRALIERAKRGSERTKARKRQQCI